MQQAYNLGSCKARNVKGCQCQLLHIPYVRRLFVAIAMPLKSLKMPMTFLWGTDCRSAAALVAPLLVLARLTKVCRRAQQLSIVTPAAARKQHRMHDVQQQEMHWTNLCQQQELLGMHECCHWTLRCARPYNVAASRTAELHCCCVNAKGWLACSGGDVIMR